MVKRRAVQQGRSACSMQPPFTAARGVQLQVAHPARQAWPGSGQPLVSVNSLTSGSRPEEGSELASRGRRLGGLGDGARWHNVPAAPGPPSTQVAARIPAGHLTGVLVLGRMHQQAPLVTIPPLLGRNTLWCQVCHLRLCRGH